MHSMRAKQANDHIMQLLAAGREFAVLAENLSNVHEAEKAARRALGYFNAAQAILTAFGELHNELIEHPEFVKARQFGRKWRF